MANDLNDCNFIGRLGAEPDTRQMPDGSNVCNIRIAVGRRWNDDNGNRQERTEWVPVVFFGPLANVADRYLSKGSKVMIKGAFRTRKWQGDDGQDRYTTEIVADWMQMLDSRPAT
ncbi:single-stranded DNA-binding protein [bacterium endosymbiont of Escarpia laminata]|nr:MAG: single-stranded DNA-binding protein [bacterium endosymbiont of Escarpia laminata]